MDTECINQPVRFSVRLLVAVVGLCSLGDASHWRRERETDYTSLSTKKSIRPNGIGYTVCFPILFCLSPFFLFHPFLRICWLIHNSQQYKIEIVETRPRHKRARHYNNNTPYRTSSGSLVVEWHLALGWQLSSRKWKGTRIFDQFEQSKKTLVVRVRVSLRRIDDNERPARGSRVRRWRCRPDGRYPAVVEPPSENRRHPSLCDSVGAGSAPGIPFRRR